MKPNALEHSAIAHRLDPQVRQVISRLPAAVVNKLSEAEMLALYQSMNRPRNHGLDLRLSLPLASSRLYFVTLVGLERRQRAPQVQAPSSPWSAGSFGLAMALSLIAGFTIGGVGYRMINQQASVMHQQPEVVDAPEIVDTPEVVDANEEMLHPAVLPWVNSATDCGGPSQQWEGGFCYEQAHHPDF